MCCGGGVLPLYPVCVCCGGSGSWSRCLVHELVALFFLMFALSKMTFTRRVSSSRIIRCMGDTRRVNGGRGRVAARLVQQKIAGRRIREVRGGCRGSGSKDPRDGARSRGHSHRHNRVDNMIGKLHAASRACSTERASITKSSLRVVSGHSLSRRGRARSPASRVCNRGVFAGSGLAFRPGIGITAPRGCHLKPNSRIVVSI